MEYWMKRDKARQDLFWFRLGNYAKKGSKVSHQRKYREIVRLDQFARGFKRGMDVTTVSNACVLAFYDSRPQSYASQRLAYDAVRVVWRLLSRKEGTVRVPELVKQRHPKLNVHQRLTACNS